MSPPGAITTAAGLVIEPELGLDELHEPGWLFIPGVMVDSEPAMLELLADSGGRAMEPGLTIYKASVQNVSTRPVSESIAVYLQLFRSRLHELPGKQQAIQLMIDFGGVFISFFAVIDPIGTVPVFIAVTQGFDARARRIIAFKATLFAAAILLFFAVAGGPILTAMSIPLSAFQISGGIVLFLFALSMIFGESKPEEETRLAEHHNETAIFPLAVPSIAGPGAMLAAVLLTDHSRFSLVEQAQTMSVMLGVLAMTLVLMLAANRVDRVIGSAGASVVSRVMGMILASVATNHILIGLGVYFEFP